MKGITLNFLKEYQQATDDIGDPVNFSIDMEVSDCLVAPISEPSTAREQQAIDQSRDQLRIHLPKAFTGDISNSSFLWGGKQFHVDSDSVVFMPENTPTRWNRYFRAEVVDNYATDILDLLAGFITEDASHFFTTENNNYYLTQEVL